jgi:transposase
MAIHTVGIDIAKTVFHLVALDEKGAVLTKKKFSRSQLLVYTANLKADVVGSTLPGSSSRRTGA